jgi:hypothetical protein
MDIFSDILSKSRFEQQPNKGNFIPRPDPKKNTTSDNEDESAVILAKESPIQGPGIPSKRSEPSKEVVGKGRKAAHTIITDDSGTDDSTYVVGLEKVDRTISRAKKAAKSHKQDLGQAAMQSRSVRLFGQRPALMTTEIRDTKPLGQMATDPQKVGIIRGQRRRSNEILNREEARRNVSDTTKKRQAAMSAAEVTGRITEKQELANFLKAKDNNIYAIATAAAEGKGEKKKEEIVRALKRGKMLLKAFGVMKSTWGKHGLHPAERRPKTATEKERDSHADGGERNFSGARGRTPALLGMLKARKIIWKEAALLYPAHRKEQQGGRKVKTRVGDSTGGYPT